MKILGITIIFLMLLVNISFAGGKSTIGMANPASVNCLKLGGVLERHTNYKGEYADCAIEEWTLYHEMLKRGLVQENSSDHDGLGMPNPASVNCENVEGELRIEQTNKGENGICVVNEWDLMKYIDITSEN